MTETQSTEPKREPLPWRHHGTGYAYILRRLLRMDPTLLEPLLEAEKTDDGLLGLVGAKVIGRKHPAKLYAVVRHLGLKIEGKPSWRKIAMATGILNGRKAHDEDKHLDRLMKAWSAADEESRAIFLHFANDDAIEPVRRGPRLSVMDDKAPPVLAKLAERMTMADVARSLDVSRETVRRWCAGKSQPKPEHLARLQEMAGKLV